MTKMRAQKKEKGFLLLESLVAIVLLAMIVVTIFPTVNFLLRRAKRATYDTEASLHLQEGMEVAYSLFSSDWDAYPSGHYRRAEDLTGPKPKWVFIPAEEEKIEGRYTRIIEVAPVLRNQANGEAGSGVVDPNSKRVTTTIRWEEGGTDQQISAELLLTNVLSN